MFLNLEKINKNKIGILRLTLDDQNNKNALSELMMGQLIEAIEEASRDNSIKIIVIAGTGNVFCSGHNLKEIKDAREDEDSGASYFLNLFNLCSSLIFQANHLQLLSGSKNTPYNPHSPELSSPLFLNVFEEV